MRFFRSAILSIGFTAPAACAQPSSASQPVRISGDVMAGIILSTAPVVYPPIAKAAHVSGSVVLRATVGKDGYVEMLQPVTGPEMLRASALDSVWQWRWKPYLQSGQTAAVETTVTVNYHLTDATAPPPETEAQVNGARPTLLKVPANVMAANVVERPEPICAPEHKGDPLNGTVVLDAVVGPDGHVANLNVLSGPEALRGCVLDAVSQWTYKPYLLNGAPVEVETTITVSFGGTEEVESVPAVRVLAAELFHRGL